MSDQYRPFGRKKRQLAEIDPEMCTGCGYCAMFCVMACIHQQENGIWEVDKDHCIGCRSCKVNCPYGAVTMLQPKQEEQE
jgi:MinD superfamily P-loop ATPase